MKKTNFTFLNKKIRSSVQLMLLFGLLVMCASKINAQECTLVCNESIVLGFDSSNSPECEAQLDIDDLLSDDGDSCPGLVGNDSIVIMNKSETVIFSTEGKVDYDRVGETLKFKVVDKTSGNSCWGYVKVEDKKPPIFTDCASLDGSTFKCYEAASFTPPVAVDCDPNIRVEMTSVRRDNNCTDPSIPDSVLSVVEVTFIAIDSWGNQSLPCSFTYSEIWIDSNAIVYPSPLLKNDTSALLCDGDYPKDEKGNPSPLGPNGTGVPMIDTFPLYPNPDQFCNLLVDYTDDVIEVNCVTKVIRRWRVYEWACTNDGSQRQFPDFIQMIEIVDDKSPTIEALPDMTVSTSSYECSARPYIPRPELKDNCSDDLSVDLTVEGASLGFYADFQGDFVKLDTGLNVLIFTAYDGCDLTAPSRDTVNVLVEDNTAPVAVCVSYTTVSLIEDGTAKIHASSFNNGSHDECLLAGMYVRRMDEGVPCGNEASDTEFDEYVEFCCADIGTVVTVVFRVYDAAGNYNECMVSVDVQDKLPPAIVCPPDLTVGCGFDYADLDVFGSIAQSASETQPIVIREPFLIEYGGNIGALTDGYAIDNCNVMVTPSFVDSLNQCNIGRIYRTFVATDPGGRSASCLQRVTIEPLDYFDEDDITFPRDTAIVGCADPDGVEFSPDNLGYPEFDEDECDLVGFNYKDEVYPFNGSGNNACFKIIRKWKVIDWCQMDIDGRDDYEWYDEQIIKVNDEVAPVFVGDFSIKQVCTFDPTCTNGYIELTATGSDNCTTELRGSYEIDANNDGSIDIPGSSSLGSVIDASGEYPIGSHRIIFTFQDRCGNVTTQEQLFTIFNCKAPTPYAINGLAVDLMPVDADNDGNPEGGMVELGASDFDAGSFHDCGYEVIVTFSADTSDNVRVFTCADEGFNDDIEIWATIVTPMGDLVQAYAITSLDVQDNMDACPNTPSAERVGVGGTIATESDLTIDNVNVALLGSEMSDIVTNTSGSYAFTDMLVGGNYTVNPSKNDYHSNGVTTLDLVKIQRHILGIKEFNSPYQMIAADINKDNGIKASDILELRKVILGIYEEFQSNTSWRFVDKGFAFSNVEDALYNGFPEEYEISNLNNDMNIDFIGVKIGDVDQDAELVRASRTTTRSRSQAFFSIEDEEYDAGEVVNIAISTTQAIEVIGLQGSFLLGQNLNLVGIKSASINLHDDQYTYDSSTGLLSFSIDNANGTSLQEGDQLFSIEVEALQSGSIGNSLSLISNPLKAEVYNSAEEVLDMNLTIESQGFSDFQLAQNTPNPFNDRTQIDFILPSDMSATLTVFDVTGKQIYVQRGQYNAGRNTISIGIQELNTAGVVYYQLQAGNYFASKKMVILK